MRLSAEERSLVVRALQAFSETSRLASTASSSPLAAARLAGGFIARFLSDEMSSTEAGRVIDANEAARLAQAVIDSVEVLIVDDTGELYGDG